MLALDDAGEDQIVCQLSDRKEGCVTSQITCIKVFKAAGCSITSVWIFRLLAWTLLVLW